MKLYNIWPVIENPLYLSLGLAGDTRELCTFPVDWQKKPLTWETRLLKPNWRTRDAEGDGLSCNDFPSMNLSYPGFSQRAVDMIGHILEANGELLPVRHKFGTYYFFNCTKVVNVVDFSRLKSGDLNKISLDSVSIFEDKLSDLIIFKDRVLPTELLCTEKFVDVVCETGLEGFLFFPVWPLPQGETYNSEKNRLYELSKKFKPKSLESIDIKANTVVLRLVCKLKKASKNEIAEAESVMDLLVNSLRDPSRPRPELYIGKVEGNDVVENEIRIFLSAPDCDELILRLRSNLKSLPWRNKYYVVKRRGDLLDEKANEEYVNIQAL